VAKILRQTKRDFSPVAPWLDNRRVRPINPFFEFQKEDIEQSIPARFEQIVEKYPDRLAIKTSDQEFTYRELNQISNRVAHAILAQRGEGEEPIALLLGYGALTIAAILGVLGAGKTYVPIDPRIPWSRKRFILEDLEKCLVVTNSGYLSSVVDPVRSDVPFLNMDKVDSDFSPDNPILRISPERAAWIIYTSGSTGHPKGVIQTHRTANHFVMNFTNGYHISSFDRFCFWGCPR
jgi:non-ribosomal peptide synthetase component F